MSENTSIQELEQRLFNTPYASRERVDLLTQLVVHYLNIDLDKTKLLIDEAEDIARQIQYQEGIGLSIQQRGVYYYLISDLENALNIFYRQMSSYPKAITGKTG